VQDDQAQGVDSIVRSRGRLLQTAPIVTMRIARINDRDVDQIIETAQNERHADSLRRGRSKASRDSVNREREQRRKNAGAGQPAGRAGWALRREFRSTYRDTVTSTEKIVAGKWFSKATLAGLSDTTEVSLEKDIADELRVKLGDVITWDVQGVQIPSRVTSLRDVTWERFEPNFFAVFAPPPFRNAPKQHVFLANIPSERVVAELQRDVVTRYPNVSSIDLTLIKQTVMRIVAKVSTAMRFMALFSLAMAIPVLFAAVAATRRDRIREGVLLKTLGATRGQIMRILLAEYALLGLLGSLTGMLLAIGGGWALTHFVFEASFTPALLPAFLIAAAMLSLTISIGLLAGRDVFRETPMHALRDV
jgi:putative ABC transport system permease protein